MLTDVFWNTLYRRWRTKAGDLTPGYTILLPVPGDLPVFLKLALHVCAAQRMRNRIETLVIPDQPGPAFTAVYEECAKRSPDQRLRLITLPWFDALVTRKLNNPSKNHWLQLIAGIDQSRSTHVLMHDADLFVAQPDFIESHYQACVTGDFDCFGVSKVWDAWYDEHGFDYLTATWEMMSRIAWLRKFPPALHRGHTGTIAGKRHVFDTTLKAQCLTPRERIGRHEREFGFVHFNYVISTYRAFQNQPGTFADDDHRILLIRLLIDAFDDSPWPYDVPTMDTLREGLTDAGARVSYCSPKAKTSYPGFRAKLEELLGSMLLSTRQAEAMRAAMAPFDEAFAWECGKVATAAGHSSR